MKSDDSDMRKDMLLVEDENSIYELDQVCLRKKNRKKKSTLKTKRHEDKNKDNDNLRL